MRITLIEDLIKKFASREASLRKAGKPYAAKMVKRCRLEAKSICDGVNWNSSITPKNPQEIKLDIEFPRGTERLVDHELLAREQIINRPNLTKRTSDVKLTAIEKLIAEHIANEVLKRFNIAAGTELQISAHNHLFSFPFCGDENAITDAYHEESVVRCQNCGATGPEGSYDECQTLWNARVDQDILTRAQAIKRIMDIRDCNQIDHIIDSLKYVDHITDCAFGDCIRSVAAELIAIFDIKEEELE